MRTVGVEEELLLVDTRTGRPRAVAEQVLKYAEERGEVGDEETGGSLAHEVQQEQLEADTRPHTTMADLREELMSWRKRADANARNAGARILAIGTSPFPAEPRLVRTDRFTAMAERFGLTASEHLTCGCHVHVSVESPDEAVGVIDRMRVWLPVLLALSGNSPYWHGVDTGYASFRSQVMTRWPTAGPPDRFGSAEAYQAQVKALIDAGAGLDEGMLYCDARPSHSYPTVEVRVPDVCADVRDTVMLSALSRAMVDTEARARHDGEAVPDASTALLRVATWVAAREGVRGELLDPRTHRTAPVAEVVHALLERVGDALRANGDEELVRDRVEALLAHGTGADRQRSVMEKTGDLLDVVTATARVTTGQEEPATV